MDYEKIVNDLFLKCSKNCAECEYSKGVEFNCKINNMAVEAITVLFEKVEQLQKENANLLKRAVQAEREMDEAVNLLKRVNDKTGNCYGCKYFDIEREVCTEKAKKSVCDCGRNNFWEWRGMSVERCGKEESAWKID